VSKHGAVISCANKATGLCVCRIDSSTCYKTDQVYTLCSHGSGPARVQAHQSRAHQKEVHIRNATS
jgi:hypothetical protein